MSSQGSGNGEGEGADKEADAQQRYSEEETNWTESIRAGNGNNNSGSSYQRPEKPKRDWVDYTTMAFLGLTFFAALGAAIEADRLARDTETALSDARDASASAHLDNVRAESLNADAVGQTTSAAQAANRSADAAKKSADTAQAQASALAGQQKIMKAELAVTQIQVRAYVDKGAIVANVEKDAPESGPGYAGEIVPSWQNYGITPARHLVNWTCMLPLNPMQADRTDFRSHTPGCPDRNPSEESYLGGGKSIGAHAHPFTASDLQAVKHGGFSFYVWGEIAYDDVIPNSVRHFSHFCMEVYFEAPRGFVFKIYKPECNYSDDDERPAKGKKKARHAR